MTVRKLISLLKKMPQGLQVGVSAHDNSEWEVAGWPTGVFLLDKGEIKCPDYIDEGGRECYNGLAKRTVVIHC